jgi:hypothetical protein
MAMYESTLMVVGVTSRLCSMALISSQMSECRQLRHLVLLKLPYPQSLRVLSDLPDVGWLTATPTMSLVISMLRLKRPVDCHVLL